MKSSSSSRARGVRPPVVHELVASLALFRILRVWTNTCVNASPKQQQQQTTTTHNNNAQQQRTTTTHNNNAQQQRTTTTHNNNAQQQRTTTTHNNNAQQQRTTTQNNANNTNNANNHTQHTHNHNHTHNTTHNTNETSEHDIVTRKHDQSDAPGRLSRIMDELEQILQLLQGAARDFCGQERMGDKTEEPGVPGELIAKPVNSDVSRGCEVLATSEWHSLEDPKTDEASKCEDAKGKPHHTLKRPHRAVSKAWNSGTWDWLEPTGTELRKARLCRQGLELYGNGETCVGPALAQDAEPGLCCMRGNRLK